MARSKRDALPQVEIHRLDALVAWLDAHHAQSTSVWLVTYKKHHASYIAWGDVVDELLCWGWVDSQVRALDADRMMHLIAPRRAGSAWSRVNKQKIARLTEANRMRPSGVATIERAQADGSWTFLDDVEDLIVPDDLAAALAQHDGAAAQFESFPRSSKRATLEWIKTAKRPETRAKRIAETASGAAEGQRVR
ncbi:MAG: YdeI/OmpD-associated family protein [Acidobacteriota bacterium]